MGVAPPKDSLPWEGRPPAKNVLLYDCTRLKSLLAACRAAPGGAADDVAVLQEPIRTQADLIKHMTAFINMLSRWPADLHVHPPRKPTDKELPSGALPPAACRSRARRGRGRVPFSCAPGDIRTIRVFS